MDKIARENFLTSIKLTLDMVDRFNKISEMLGKPDLDRVSYYLIPLGQGFTPT